VSSTFHIHSIENFDIYAEDDGHEQELSRLEKGGYFGELALITHKPRAASAYALSDEVKLACMQNSILNFDLFNTYLIDLNLS